MKILKKLSINIRSSFEGLINQMENHEAVSLAALRNYQADLAKAKVRLKRMEAESEKLEKQLQESKDEIKQWEERARRFASEDRQKAIDCLKRKKRLEEQLDSKSSNLVSVQNSVSDAQIIVSSMVEKIELIKNKRNEFVIRDSCSKLVDHSVIGEEEPMEDLFDRWETALVAREAIAESKFEVTDNFETLIEKEEKDTQLEAELDEMLNSKN